MTSPAAAAARPPPLARRRLPAAARLPLACRRRRRRGCSPAAVPLPSLGTPGHLLPSSLLSSPGHPPPPSSSPYPRSAKKVGRIMEEMNRMLNASKGPTPDLLQLTFARARWNNPTACIAALEGVPHVTPELGDC
uniref:Uncharacterized protein n=1 Tax=Oryza nivara TaxID=4536 RepID=A0A0E0HR85_ORYNI